MFLEVVDVFAFNINLCQVGKFTIWVRNRSKMDEDPFQVTVNSDCNIDSLKDAIISVIRPSQPNCSKNIMNIYQYAEETTINPLSPDVIVSNVGNIVGKHISAPFYYTGIFVLFVCIIITLVNTSTTSVTIPAGIVYTYCIYSM